MIQESARSVTHASPKCPLRTIDLYWGTAFIEDVGLTVEVVTDDNPETLQQIKITAMKTCAECLYHYSKPDGTCKPGGHIYILELLDPLS